MLTTWGLSQAQAAATLATILVRREAGLFPRTVFDGAILMVLFTSITSPILVGRFGAGLKPAKKEREPKPYFEAMAKAMDVPILVLATSHYVEHLKQNLEGSETEWQVKRAGQDIVADVSEEIAEGYFLILTTMGSQARFQQDLEKVPEMLAEALSNSIAVLHHP